jgi:homogentisate 1,2-dioxygenase
MPPYLRRGELPRKRHIALRREPGFAGEGICYEEVITTGGFGRAYSIVYHLRPPTRVRKVDPAGTLPVEVVAQEALRHHHLRTARLPRKGDPIFGRVYVLVNDDVMLARCRPAAAQAELYRNASADEVVFVHNGRGVLHTMFGSLAFGPCDYLVIPRCVTYQLEFEQVDRAELLVIEATGSLNVPARYLNADGQLRLGAPYAERDLHGPEEARAIDRDGDVTVVF